MRWPYILSLIALLGASLLLFFNILCGATNHAPLNKWYWLEADTSSIPGAHSVSRWTSYDTCGVSNGKNVDCSGKSAAYPMSPVSNFGTTDGVPSGLSSKHGVTYYLSKAGWAFLLMGLFFSLFAVIPILISFCVPSMTPLTVGSGVATAAAFVFTIIAAALLTSCYVKARNAFNDNGNSANIGKTMIAFLWTSCFLLAFSSIFSGVGCMGNMFGQRRKRHSEDYDLSSHETYGNEYATEKDQPKHSFFGKKKSPRTEDLEEGYAAGVGSKRETSDYAQTRGSTGIGKNQKAGYENHGVGYGAGYGAGAVAGAAALGSAAVGTSAAVGGSKGHNNESREAANGTRDFGHADKPKANESLDDVAYASNIGSTNANPKYGNVDRSVKQHSGIGMGTTGTSSNDQRFNSESTGPDAVGNYGNMDYSGPTENNPNSMNISTNQAAHDRSTGASNALKTDTGYTGSGNSGADTSSSPYVEKSGKSQISYPSKGIWASAAAAIGLGGTVAATSRGGDAHAADTKVGDNGEGFKPDMTGTGLGSTSAGLNAEEEGKKAKTYENKSTVLPVGGTHVTNDPYGNETLGFKTGVPDGSARSAAAASAIGGIGSAGETSSAVGKGTHRPINDGDDSNPEGTYKSSGKDFIRGYEPTSYYSSNIEGKNVSGKKIPHTDAAISTGRYGNTVKGDKLGDVAHDNVNNGEPRGYVSRQKPTESLGNDTKTDLKNIDSQKYSSRNEKNSGISGWLGDRANRGPVSSSAYGDTNVNAGANTGYRDTSGISDGMNSNRNEQRKMSTSADERGLAGTTSLGTKSDIGKAPGKIDSGIEPSFENKSQDIYGHAEGSPYGKGSLSDSNGHKKKDQESSPIGNARGKGLGDSNTSPLYSKRTTEDEHIPGTFPGASNSSNSPILEDFKENDSNYVSSGVGSNVHSEPRSFNDDTMTGSKEAEQPSIIQQIVDTAKSVI